MSLSASTAPHSNYNQSRFNPWVVMAFMAIPVFVGSLDLTVVSAFLPELITQLGLPLDTGLDDASWIVTSYLLAYTVSLTFMGRLSDLIGRRGVYVICLLVFIAGSVMVAMAPYELTDWLYGVYRRSGQRIDPAIVTLQILIVGRVIEALGAGALVPVTLALVGDIFPPERRARPLGLVAATDTLGWVLGPVYGAVFMQIMPWEGLFWMNVPLTLLSLFLVLYALRDVPQLKAQGRFDFIGTFFIVVALSALSIGLGGNVDFSGASLDTLTGLPPYAVPVLSAGLVAFILFLLVESRVRYPLVNLQMFRRRNLSAALIVNLFVGYILFIGLVSVPILVNIRQEDATTLTAAALQVGALLSTLTIPMAIAAVPGGWLSDKIGLRWTIIGGLSLAVVGFAWVWQSWTIDISDSLIALQMALVGVGIGLTFSPVSTAIINSAYDEERGVAGALVLVVRLVGMTVSVSSLSSIMLNRVNVLAGEAVGAVGFGAETVDAYVGAAVHVLGEMGLIGAVLALIAIVPALWIGKTAQPPPREETNEALTTHQTPPATTA
jgi:MFS family permease